LALRAISISKVLFDENWHELSSSELGAREQQNVYSSIVLLAKAQKSEVKIKIVGYDIPKKLVFQMNSKIRIGNNMIIYNDNNVFKQDTESLPLGSLDSEF